MRSLYFTSLLKKKISNERFFCICVISKLVRRKSKSNRVERKLGVEFSFQLRDEKKCLEYVRFFVLKKRKR